MVSAFTWLTAMGAVVSFAQGTIAATLSGAALLHLWYLLDHVDGQVARLRGTASLSGVQLDYLMHHFVSLTLPASMGWGCFSVRQEPLWLLAGLVWSLAATLAAMVDDTRAKAFLQRLKAFHGDLFVQGRAGRTNRYQPIPRRGLFAQTSWLLQKACEQHVTLNMLTLLALARWLVSDHTNRLGAIYLAGMALIALAVASSRIIRQTRAGTADAEFASWFQPLEAPPRRAGQDATTTIFPPTSQPHREPRNGGSQALSPSTGIALARSRQAT